VTMETIDAGHRTVPTALGLVLKIWGPTRGACFTEAVPGLVATFADVSFTKTSQPVPVHIDRDDDEGLLAALLDEVLSLFRILGVVPVDGAVLETEDGGLVGCFDVAAVTRVRLIGPIPRAVTDPRVERSDDRAEWRCQVTVKQ
jgi:SHS2 domain-containing protein